ncbi:unnamed protein product [Effrenium voratum]|uniref:Glycosyltransferase 2-like domain-containing protein n=1 Tax=Effrenium voratum TaxID=2562239 RepID=A0AA36I3F5_9DINO|nr:unnamed protein product [Effrenium voratum]CAJ1427969.1 unnamed protein product [Effrenium voratum]
MKLSDQKNPIRQFYRVNIHEERAAAYIVRFIPFGLLLVTVCFLALGVYRSSSLLLWITATLNVAMWLWIVSVAVTCILGVRVAQDEISKADGQMCPEPTSDNQPEKQPETEPKGTPEGGRSQDKVRHIIAIPNYKEDKDILQVTLNSLIEARGSKDFIVVLAMEDREGLQGSQKAKELQAAFKDHFAEIILCFHPEGIKEMHLDGSWDPEVKGKASNVKFAVKKVCEDIQERSEYDVLTIIDADVILHPMYFHRINESFAKLKDEGNEEHTCTFWQAPQLPWRNLDESPAVSRVWGYISSLWEFGGVSGLLCGGHHMVFSGYSLPLNLAEQAQCWDGDIIAEDHHAFLKAWFYFVFESRKKEASSNALVRVRPVMLPAKSTSVVSPDGYWATWYERWNQAKRHAQGVAEFSFALLAAWDMLCSLPATSVGPGFLWQLFRVVLKPFMMHIVATLQAVSLAVLTCYWFASGRQIPGCPEQLMLTSTGDTLLCGLAGAWVLTWPIVIPFCFLLVANILMISICFVMPNAEKEKPKVASIWHSEDGGVKPWESWMLGPFQGSQHFKVLCIVVFEVLVCLGPIMAVYGVGVEILAYWNVMVRGNHFEYISAPKASKMDYGSMAIAQEAISKKAHTGGKQLASEENATSPEKTPEIP